jgi:hypothetical protein
MDVVAAQETWRVKIEGEDGRPEFKRVTVERKEVGAEVTYLATTPNGFNSGPTPRLAVMHYARLEDWPVMSIIGPNDPDEFADVFKACVDACGEVVCEWRDLADAGGNLDLSDEECELVAEGADRARDKIRELTEPETGREE